METMADLLNALIRASERAANIARSCCSETCKDSILVTEKKGGDANARFEEDFKTIADVLAQESAKYEIREQFPELARHVRGEESAQINGITIKRCDRVNETEKILGSLVPSQIAKVMAEAAHSKITLTPAKVTVDLTDLKPEDLGIWIDPIDATAEFIAGAQGKTGAESGLSCVTVLIGAYIRTTGEPVMGVINQPFYDNGKGRIIWGICYGEIQENYGIPVRNEPSKVVLMSGAEDPQVHEAIEKAGWRVKSIPGAGHKLLKVALGEADAYLLSLGTTYRWDTCAPHAILRSKGGNIMSYINRIPLCYHDPDYSNTQQYANSDGLIAFSDPTLYEILVETLNPAFTY